MPTFALIRSLTRLHCVCYYSDSWFQYPIARLKRALSSMVWSYYGYVTVPRRANLRAQQTVSVMWLAYLIHTRFFMTLVCSQSNGVGRQRVSATVKWLPSCTNILKIILRCLIKALHYSHLWRFSVLIRVSDCISVGTSLTTLFAIASL